MTVLCHDGIRILSGEAVSIGTDRCEIEVHGGQGHGHEAEQPFGANALLTLNFVNDTKGQSLNVRACLVRAYQRQGKWLYVFKLKSTYATALRELAA